MAPPSQRTINRLLDTTHDRFISCVLLFTKFAACFKWSSRPLRLQVDGSGRGLEVWQWLQKDLGHYENPGKISSGWIKKKKKQKKSPWGEFFKNCRVKSSAWCKRKADASECFCGFRESRFGLNGVSPVMPEKQDLIVSVCSEDRSGVQTFESSLFDRQCDDWKMCVTFWGREVTAMWNWIAWKCDQ